MLEHVFEATGDCFSGGHLLLGNDGRGEGGVISISKPRPLPATSFAKRHGFWSHSQLRRRGGHRPPLLTVAEDSAISLIRTMIEERARSRTGNHPLAFPGYWKDSASPCCNHTSSFHGHFELDSYCNLGIYKPLSFSLTAFDQSNVFLSSYCV